MRPVLAVLLAAGALAGCLSDDGGPGDGLTLIERVTAGQPPIDWDVSAEVDWWEDIASNYPKHDSNLPTNAMLRERIVDDLEDLGLDVEVRAYQGSFQGQDIPQASATELHAIIATKQGTDLPDRRIGLVSHYDTQTLTVHGAYDDASGVAADHSVCKALAKVELRRTLACIFFDGEERGLVASQRYVEDVVLEGDEGYVYDFVLGYDMTGINWPGHAWKLYAMIGMVWDRPGDDEPEVSPLYPFAQDLLNGALGYPPEGVEVRDDSHRNSDERRFKEAGVPIIRFAGGLNATDYDQYHKPLDTVEHVYEVTDGRANFEAGFAAVVEASYATALALDRTDFAEVSAAYAGSLA